MVVSSQEPSLSFDFRADCLIHLGLADVFEQHVGSSNTAVQVAPVAQYLGVGRGDVVVTDRAFVDRIAFVSQIGRQAYAPQHIDAVDRVVGQCRIDAEQGRLELFFGFVEFTGLNEVFGFGVQ